MHDPGVAPWDESGHRLATRAEITLSRGSCFREHRPRDESGWLPAFAPLLEAEGSGGKRVAPASHGKQHSQSGRASLPVAGESSSVNVPAEAAGGTTRPSPEPATRSPSQPIREADGWHEHVLFSSGVRQLPPTCDGLRQRSSVTARHSSISKQRATQANPSPMQGRDVTVPRKKFVSRRLGRLRQLLLFFDLFLRSAEALREVDADELLTEVAR